MESKKRPDFTIDNILSVTVKTEESPPKNSVFEDRIMDADSTVIMDSTAKDQRNTSSSSNIAQFMDSTNESDEFEDQEISHGIF